MNNPSVLAPVFAIAVLAGTTLSTTLASAQIAEPSGIPITGGTIVIPGTSIDFRRGALLPNSLGFPNLKTPQGDIFIDPRGGLDLEKNPGVYLKTGDQTQPFVDSSQPTVNPPVRFFATGVGYDSQGPFIFAKVPTTVVFSGASPLAGTPFFVFRVSTGQFADGPTITSVDGEVISLDPSNFSFKPGVIPLATDSDNDISDEELADVEDELPVQEAAAVTVAAVSSPVLSTVLSPNFNANSITFVPLTPSSGLLTNTNNTTVVDVTNARLVSDRVVGNLSSSLLFEEAKDLRFLLQLERFDPNRIAASPFPFAHDSGQNFWRQQTWEAPHAERSNRVYSRIFPAYGLSQ